MSRILENLVSLFVLDSRVSHFFLAPRTISLGVPWLPFNTISVLLPIEEQASFRSENGYVSVFLKINLSKDESIHRKGRTFRDTFRVLQGREE